MDSLCNQVLSSCPPSLRERLHRVLSAIVVLEIPTIAALSDLLELDTSDLSTVLHILRNIVQVEELPGIPPDLAEFPVATYLSPIVSFLDSEFCSEFFTDKSKADALWVDRGASHKSLQERADFLLSESISPSPVPIHRSTWRTIFHCLAGLWTENDDDIIHPWQDSWPLFTNEMQAFQLADPTQQRVVTSNRQSLRTFRFLLRCCKEAKGDAYLSEQGANFKTAQSVVAAALREWFDKLSPESKGFFAILPYLFHSETSMWAETVEEISTQPHLSWEMVLRIIDHSHGFVDLDSGNPHDLDDPNSHALRVCVDWSLVDVMKDSSVVGQRFFAAYREARVSALRDTYEEFLNEEDPDLLHRKAWGLFRKPMRHPLILTLNPEIDERATSALPELLDRIHSPQSLSVLLSPDLSYLGCHSFFVPLMFFVILNCQEASVLGPNFKAQHDKLKDLIVIFMQNGVLAAAFGDPDYHDALEQRQLFMIYKTLSDFGALDQGQWFDLADSHAHTAIIEFFLGEYLVERFYDKRAACVCVEWSHHFSSADTSPKIVELLLALRIKLQDRGSTSMYAPLLSTGLFATGLRIWKEKYVEKDSNATPALDELCAQLFSIDWPTVKKYKRPTNW